jgi:hypothetical protein
LVALRQVSRGRIQACRRIEGRVRGGVAIRRFACFATGTIGDCDWRVDWLASVDTFGCITRRHSDVTADSAVRLHDRSIRASDIRLGGASFGGTVGLRARVTRAGRDSER